MTNTIEGRAERGDKDHSFMLALQPETSHMQASDGSAIPFTRAVLTMQNVSAAELLNIVPHATLGQEGGTVQDISGHLCQSAPASLPPGAMVSWDVYDLLLSAHPGAASKIHMFGYRAILNWRFDLAAWAEYRFPDSAAPAETQVSRWTLQWSIPDPSARAVALVIKDVNI